jgi:MFS family permease
MIITCKKQVPFRWIPFTFLPWGSFAFNNVVMSVAFIFSLKKFVENPVGITFIMSMPTFFSIITVPISNFLSDRVWTKFGRRKPFVVSAGIGMAMCMGLMPLVPNFWLLLAVYFAFNMCNDIGGGSGPMEPLSQEIVPPHQRGRAIGVRQWYSNFGGLTFYFFAFGRFDDVRYMAGMPLVGETAIYWIAGLLIIVVLLFVMLGIKELDQKSALCGQRLSFRNFFGGILDQELWPVFMLIFGSAMLDSGLGVLANLLYIDQWNYSKQEMGINVVTGGIINMFLIGFLAIFADRLNRMRAYQALIIIAIAIKATYFVYVNISGLIAGQR